MSGQAFLAKSGLIVLITLAAYLPALRGGFVFDDYPLITENGMVRADDGIRLFWSGAGTADYYPLTGSLWWLEWRWWGDHAMGYHVLDVLLHAADAVLLWMILRRLNIPGAWLAALMFAIHPVNVATAAWISEQKNTLSMLFYAVAILLYLRFNAESRWRWYAWSLGAFLLALCSKTAVVMLPFALLGCVWWLHGRLRWKDWLRGAPFFALSFLFGLVTVWFERNHVPRGRIFFPTGGGGLGGLVLPGQGPVAGQPVRHLSEVERRCVTGDVVASIVVAGWMPGAVLVEAKDVGEAAVVRRGVFRGDAVPRVGIL